MKKGLFFGLIAAVAMLASCNKQVPRPDELYCTPNPLVKVGDKVEAELTGTFPEKKFAKKGVLTVTPVLKFDGKEVLGQPVTYVGEKAKENGKTVNYKKGGTYSQKCSFDFEPGMRKSELYLRFEARDNKTRSIRSPIPSPIVSLTVKPPSCLSSCVACIIESRSRSCFAVAQAFSALIRTEYGMLFSVASPFSIPF